MLRTYNVIVIGIVCVAVGGCGALQKKEKEDEKTTKLPQWVMNPTVEGGIASTECVAAHGDLSADKSKATALARQSLAQQINTRVESMEKTYERSVETDEGQDTGRTFVSVSKQLADEQVQGSRAVKVQYVDINGERNLCTMVALNPKQTRKLFEEIVSKSDQDVPPESKESLYEQFKAEKAQEELEEEIE